jgi:hypothetical protein
MPDNVKKSNSNYDIKGTLRKNDDFSMLSTRVVTKESNMDEINHDPLIDFFEGP